MVFSIVELRNAVSKKYGVNFITPPWTTHWEAKTEDTVVFEPKDYEKYNYKESGWLFYAMHEIGHIKSGHKTQSQDLYERLSNEAEAWRWARNELSVLGIEIPSSYIHECF